MRIRKRGVWAVLMALALILTGIPLAPSNEAEAAKKMKLSKTKLSLKVGKTKKLTVKNKKKKAKVTWTTSKKKVATVSKKGVVKAKKAGKATITAKVRYKKKTTKLKCKVTVTKKKTVTPTPDVKPTEKPTAGPTENSTETPTAKPTAKPTVKPTARPTAKPTATPAPDVPDPAKTEKWDAKTMGGFYVSGIRFADDSLTYSMYDNIIYLDLGSQYMDVKAAVPDLMKCSFEVYAGGKSYTEVEIGDIQWKNSYNGCYTFTLYINVDGTTYSSAWEMREGEADYTDARELLLSSVKAGDKTIALQKDVRSESSHYMFSPVGANVKADLPDLKVAEFTAAYMGKPVTVEKVSNIRWHNNSYYETWDRGTGYYSFTLHAKNGAQKMAFDLSLSDCKDLLEINQYSYQIDGKEIKEPIAEYNQILSVEVPEGKSLKEVFPDLSASFTFECIYRDTVYQNIKPTDVKWVEESFHDNQCDKGYYAFILSVTVGGKTITEEFMLTEKYRGITHEVSGKLFSADGESPAGQELRFWDKNGDDCTVTTAADGTYKVRLQEGWHAIFWNRCRLDCAVTVEKKDMTYDIRTNMRKASGVITRLGKAMADCDICFAMEDERIAYCHTDSKGAYSVYLPKSGAARLVLYSSVEEILNYDEGKELTGWDDAMLGKIHKNNNIDIQRVKVSGIICRTGTTPLGGVWCNFRVISEDEEYWLDNRFLTQDDGSYELYLNPDQSYQLWADNDDILVEKEVKIGKTDVEKNFNVSATRIRGTLKAKNGDAVPDQMLQFYSSESDSVYFAYTDSKGKYSAILKPGIYSVKERWGTELEQKVTVGTEDQVMDLTAPLYKVSATVYNNDQKWEDSLMVENGEGMSDVIYMEDGRHEFYVPEGKYICNIQYSSDKEQIITVKDRDLEQELHFTYQKVTGNIYRLRKGNWFDPIADENNSICLSIEDEEGNELESIWVYGGPTDYEVYLPRAGTYKVMFHGEEMCSFTVQSQPEITQDIVCKIYRVSGEVTGIREQKGVWNFLSFFSENGYIYEAELGKPDTATGKQPYAVYLPAGNYSYNASFNEIQKSGEIKVSDDVENATIEMPAVYKISGTVTRMSRPWAGVRIEYNNYEDDSYHYTETDENGSYEVYVTSGEYDYYVKGGALADPDDSSDPQTVTVSDKDVTKDFSFDLVEISGTVTRNGIGLRNVRIDVVKGEESLNSIWTDSDGTYVFYVDPDASYTLSVFGKEKTVTVAKEDLSWDIAVTPTKVSGILTESDGSPSSVEWFQIYQKDEEGNGENYIDVDTDDKGRFECYLSAGTYYISYGIENEDGAYVACEHGPLTVGAEDMTYNIQKKIEEQMMP